MTGDRLVDEAAQRLWIDGIEFDRDGAEPLAAAVALLGGTGWQIPCPNLRAGNGQTLEVDDRAGRKITQALLDLLASIDAGRIEVAKVVDEDRHGQRADVLGGGVQERER